MRGLNSELLLNIPTQPVSPNHAVPTQNRIPDLNPDGTGEIPGLTYSRHTNIAQRFPNNYSGNGVAVTNFPADDPVMLNPAKYNLGDRGDVTYPQVNTTGGYSEVIDVLLKRKELNGDRPLNTIILSTHGGPGTVSFADGQDMKVSVLLGDLMRRGIIGKGSTIRLAGCLVANTAEARSELSAWAKHFEVTIVANRDKVRGGIPTMVQYTFGRDGKTTESYLTKPD